MLAHQLGVVCRMPLIHYRLGPALQEGVDRGVQAVAASLLVPLDQAAADQRLLKAIVACSSVAQTAAMASQSQSSGMAPKAASAAAAARVGLIGQRVVGEADDRVERELPLRRRGRGRSQRRRDGGRSQRRGRRHRRTGIAPGAFRGRAAR